MSESATTQFQPSILKQKTLLVIFFLVIVGLIAAIIVIVDFKFSKNPSKTASKSATPSVDVDYGFSPDKPLAVPTTVNSFSGVVVEVNYSQKTLKVKQNIDGLIYTVALTKEAIIYSGRDLVAFESLKKDASVNIISKTAQKLDTKTSFSADIITF